MYTTNAPVVSPTNVYMVITFTFSFVYVDAPDVGTLTDESDIRKLNLTCPYETKVHSGRTIICRPHLARNLPMAWDYNIYPIGDWYVISIWSFAVILKQQYILFMSSFFNLYIFLSLTIFWHEISQ